MSIFVHYNIFVKLQYRFSLDENEQLFPEVMGEGPRMRVSDQQQQQQQYATQSQRDSGRRRQESTESSRNY